MKIYVQSAGRSQEQDYFWQTITSKSQEKVDEPEFINKAKSLLQTQAYSIFIGRENDELILLITGMKASQRKDYRGRVIRNSIAFITEDSEEKEIRKLAVLALKEELEGKIDDAITEEEKEGFKVDYDKIQNLIETTAEIGNSDGVTRKEMIGKNTENNRNIIAGEVKYNRLPIPKKTDSFEALLVVTGIKTEDALKNEGVWRGLSNLIEKENLTPYAPPNQLQKNFPDAQGNGKTYQKYIIPLIISLGGIGIIGLLFFGNVIQFFLGQIYPNSNTFFLASISPNAQYFVTTDSSGKMLVQNTENNTKNIINNKTSITSVTISSDGKYVVTGDEKGNIELWNLINKTTKKIDLIPNKKNVDLPHHNKAILSLGINVSKNPIKIVSSGADGQVLLWDVTIENNQGRTDVLRLNQ